MVTNYYISVSEGDVMDMDVKVAETEVDSFNITLVVFRRLKLHTCF